MIISGTRLGEIVKRILRPTNLLGGMALVVVIGAGVFADHQNLVVFEQSQRGDVQHQVDLIRARLEGAVNGNIALVRGLIGAITSEPNMNQARFATLARSLFREDNQIEEIAGAPGMVVSLIYPLAGNEKALGFDYRSDDVQRAAVLQARDQARMVFVGPITLVQGGQAFIVRFPVFSKIAGSRRFWGILSAIIDVQRIYQQTGLLDPKLGLDVAILGMDPKNQHRVRFFGTAGPGQHHPVVADVSLPSRTWRIEATPSGGWNLSPPNSWWMRVTFALAGLLVLAPIFFASRLLNERQRHTEELGQREAELARLSRRLGLALEASQIGVWEMDIAKGVLVWDDRMNELYGQPCDGGPRNYSHWRNALHPDDLERAQLEYQEAVNSQGRYHSEYRVVMPGGKVRNIRAIGAVYNDDGATPKILGVNWDVSADVARNEDIKRAKSLTEARNIELESAKARIEHNSLHDTLTGLPNRRYLDEILSEYAARSTRSGGSAALLHIDLDRFKQINDTLGHAAGDAMLIHASEILKANVREGDFVARIGGDEFVVVCLSEGTPIQLASRAQAIINEMRRPVCYHGHECRFGVSIGIAREVGPELDPKRLLVNADIALYRAKSEGRNRHEFFNDALQAEIIRNKRIADDILAGLERHEFIAHYQPQFNARTFEIVGVEALVRWAHPGEGMLGPDAFLPIAEELSVVSSLDRLILEQTLENLDKWETQGVMIPRASVNVSARRLHDENLIRGLRELAIEPERISFELVESIYLDESDDIVSWNIDQIKDLGIDIEIDDFGTGYASIVSLLKLSPRRLKIDRQLVMPITSSEGQRHLVSSIVDIGKSLNIEVVAEGVETIEHAHILRDLGCDVLQGYALARPMSAEKLRDFVKEGAWRNAASSSSSGNRRAG